MPIPVSPIVPPDALEEAGELLRLHKLRGNPFEEAWEDAAEVAANDPYSAEALEWARAQIAEAYGHQPGSRASTQPMPGGVESL